MPLQGRNSHYISTACVMDVFHSASLVLCINARNFGITYIPLLFLFITLQICTKTILPCPSHSKAQRTFPAGLNTLPALNALPVPHLFHIQLAKGNTGIAAIALFIIHLYPHHGHLMEQRIKCPKRTDKSAKAPKKKHCRKDYHCQNCYFP